MSKHTAGPWVIQVDPTEFRCKAVKGRQEYEPGEFASVWVAREVSEEDAKLIAAAPDLLEAARWALRGLEQLAAEDAERRGSTPELCDYTFAKGLRAAIAKAEGRA